VAVITILAAAIRCKALVKEEEEEVQDSSSSIEGMG